MSGVSVVRGVHDLGASLFPEHLAGQYPGLGDIIAIHGLVSLLLQSARVIGRYLLDALVCEEVFEVVLALLALPLTEEGLLLLLTSFLPFTVTLVVVRPFFTLLLIALVRSLGLQQRVDKHTAFFIAPAVFDVQTCWLGSFVLVPSDHQLCIVQR